MNKNINLIAFGTFGNPNGFRQTFFIGRKELSQVVKTFDLNTNAIKLIPNSKVYSIRKENLNGLNSISYAIYTFAKEQNSERGGTFIGSSLLYTSEIANESLTISLLNDFHESLISKNVQNDIIKVNHSDKFSVTKPNDFDKIHFNLNTIEDVNFSHFSNKVLVVYSDIKYDAIKTLLQKSLELLNSYDTIYFTDNNEIAEFVHHKGLFKLVKVDGFEQEIAAIHNERKYKISNSISEFEREKQKLDTDKSFVLSEIDNQIQNGERAHNENDRIIKESKNNLEKVNSFYNEFSKKLDDYINQLKSGRKLEQVKELYNENKRIFVTSITELKQPIYIKNLPKVKANSNLQVERQRITASNFESISHENSYESPRKRRKFNYYKISTFILSLLWIFTIVYLVWFREVPKDATQNEPIVHLEEPVKIPEPIKVIEPTPLPNSVLNDKDLKLVVKEGTKGKSVSQIVDFIFTKNPTEIAGYYKNQKEVYEQYLISKNKNCFQEQNCICDSLKVIPSYKKE